MATGQVGFFTDLTGAEAGFNTNLVANELGLEMALFGNTNALNGVVNGAFNVGNLILETGEQTVNNFAAGLSVPSIVLASGTGAVGGYDGLEGFLNLMPGVGVTAS